MSELDVVNITKKLATEIKQGKVKKQITDRLVELNLNSQPHKNKQEVLLLICNLIEFLIKKEDGISKRDLAMDILHELYSLSPTDKPVYESNIDFLCSTKMVKKVSSWKLFCAGLSEYFFSKKK